MDDENAFDQTTQARTELVRNLLAAIKVNRYYLLQYLQYYTYNATRGNQKSYLPDHFTVALDFHFWHYMID